MSSILNNSAIITPQRLIEQLRWRYATQKFDPGRTIPDPIWTVLEEVLVLSPSSYGLQPWKFIVVNNPQVRKKLQTVSWNQPQIVEASHLVVFAYKRDLNASYVERYTQRIAQVRKIPAATLEGFKEAMVGFINQSASGFDLNNWASRQVYIALGTFLTSAAILGIDTCPIEGIDTVRYDEILGLKKDSYHTLCVAAAGYRIHDDPSAGLFKVRYPSQEVIAHI